MSTIIVRPSRYRQFGPAEGSTFWFITNSDLIERFTIETDGSYAAYHTLTYDNEGAIDELLACHIPESAHILVASPNCFFRSPEPSKMGQRKLIAMACNSTPTSLEAIEHFLGILERTDPEHQQAMAERFFALGEASEQLTLVDETYETYATFDHLHDSYEWHQQAGPLAWGEQQIAPAGEISVLPTDIWKFSAELHLAVNGEIAFRGLPILHAGEASFLRTDQTRIWGQLHHIAHHALIARVQDGVITGLRPTHADVAPAARMLEMMFEVDSRYRLIWELGFAINTALDLLWGNHAMNEVYGGINGVLHCGLGLTPYTQYHLDIICPGTRVFGRDGELMLGSPRFVESCNRSEV